MAKRKRVLKSVNLAEIDPTKLNIINEEDRIFKGFLSVEIVDKQGDIVPIEELEKVMTALMKRGGVITDTHSNRVVGKILNWQKVIKDGKPAILITGQIFKDYSYDDLVWEKIKNGEYRGLSIGGIATQKKEGGVNKLEKLELFEVSVCEDPANPEAVITAVNTLAKSASVEKDCKDRYLVEEPGGGSHFKEMSCPDDPSSKSRFCGCVRYFMNCKNRSLDSAKRICAYIKRLKYGKAMLDEDDWLNIIDDALIGVAKALVEVMKPFAGFKDFNDCLQHMKDKGYDEDSAKRICGKLQAEYEKSMTVFVNKPDDLRPPKKWWERCVEETGSEALCGWVYYHHLKPTPQEGDKPETREARERKREWLNQSKSEKDKSIDGTNLSGEQSLTEEPVQNENVNKQEGVPPAEDNGNESTREMLVEIRNMLQELLSKMSATTKADDGVVATSEPPPPGNPPKPETDKEKERDRDVKLSESDIKAIASEVVKMLEDKIKKSESEPEPKVEKSDEPKPIAKSVKTEAPPVVDEVVEKTAPNGLTPAMILEAMREGKDIKKLVSKYFGW